MNKYQRLQHELETRGHGDLKAFGQSMKPILQSGSLLHFEKRTSYNVGDIVFCKVKGRYIDARLVTRVDGQGRHLISNIHGYDNGWTRQIYGKVVRAVMPGGTVKTFR